MAEWKKLPEEPIDPDFAAIRSLFLDGTINKMYKLIDYSPAKIIRLLKSTYSLYHDKLKEPWKFGMQHILKLAYAIRVDPQVIIDVIQRESENNTREEYQRYLDKVAELKKQKPKGS